MQSKSLLFPAEFQVVVSFVQNYNTTTFHFSDFHYANVKAVAKYTYFIPQDKAMLFSSTLNLYTSFNFIFFFQSTKI